MEQYNVIIQAISSVGFPIVACGFLAYVVVKQMKEFQGAVNSLENSIIILNERLSTLLPKGDGE